MQQQNSDGSDSGASSVICAVMDGSPGAWVPMVDHGIALRQLKRAHRALEKIAAVIEEFVDDEQNDLVREDEAMPPQEPMKG